MKMTDPLFEEIYNEQVLQELEQRFGPIHRRHIDMSISTNNMLDLMDKMNRKRRRGEVVMVVPNQQGHVWLHTKAFYPPDVYRLMTGGLEPGERPDRAFRREVEEETGFKTKIDRCLAIITYTLTAENTIVPFVSYVFLTAPTNGFPQPTDPGEEITNFRAIPVEALAGTAQKLRSLEGAFADWGKFRAIAHEVVRGRYRLP